MDKIDKLIEVLLRLQQVRDAIPNLSDVNGIREKFYTTRAALRAEYDAQAARIAELVEQANAAYAPYRELVFEARAETDKYAAKAYKLEQALRPLVAYIDAGDWRSNSLDKIMRTARDVLDKTPSDSA